MLLPIEYLPWKMPLSWSDTIYSLIFKKLYIYLPAERMTFSYCWYQRGNIQHNIFNPFYIIRMGYGIGSTLADGLIERNTGTDDVLEREDKEQGWWTITIVLRIGFVRKSGCEPVHFLSFAFSGLSCDVDDTPPATAAVLVLVVVHSMVSSSTSSTRVLTTTVGSRSTTISLITAECVGTCVVLYCRHNKDP